MSAGTGSPRACRSCASNRDIETGSERYRSRNDLTARQATVDVRSTVLGLRYITTIADGRETNNLLRLPRF